MVVTVTGMEIRWHNLVTVTGMEIRSNSRWRGFADSDLDQSFAPSLRDSPKLGIENNDKAVLRQHSKPSRCEKGDFVSVDT